MRTALGRLFLFFILIVCFSAIIPVGSLIFWDPIVLLILLLTFLRVPRPEAAMWVLFFAIFLEFATNLFPGAQIVSAFAALTAVWGSEIWFGALSRWFVVLVQVFVGTAAYRVVLTLATVLLQGDRDSFWESLFAFVYVPHFFIALALHAIAVSILLRIFRSLRRAASDRFLFAQHP